MKRLIASVTIMLVFACYLVSCEKDDLCADTTPTTPNLIIEFYNSDSPDDLTTVNGLQLFVEGSQDTIQAGTVSTIQLPLRVDATSTKWGLIYYRPNTGTVIPNTDYLEFKYTTRTEYVSRACGYKTLFTLDAPNGTPPNPVLTNGTDSPTFWIDNVEVLKTNIENEDDVHIKIYF